MFLLLPNVTRGIDKDRWMERKKTPVVVRVSCCIESHKREKKESRKEKEKKKGLGGGEKRGKKEERIKAPEMVARPIRIWTEFVYGVSSACHRSDKSVKPDL